MAQTNDNHRTTCNSLPGASAPGNAATAHEEPGDTARPCPPEHPVTGSSNDGAVPDGGTDSEAVPASAAQSRPQEEPAESTPADRKKARPAGGQKNAAQAHQTLAMLAGRFPELFGPQPQPLKRGIFKDLVNALPDTGPAALKLALSLHTRSTPYLQAVASGHARHDLHGAAVEPVSIEHAFHALTQLYQRRLWRQNKDARNKDARNKSGRHLRADTEQPAAWFSRRIVHSIDQSGLPPASYALAVTTEDPAVRTLLDAAVEQAQARQARDDAMLTALEASGADMAVFAETYGLTALQAQAMTGRARQRRSQSSKAAQPAAEAAGEPGGED